MDFRTNAHKQLIFDHTVVVKIHPFCLFKLENIHILGEKKAKNVLFLREDLFLRDQIFFAKNPPKHEKFLRTPLLQAIYAYILYLLFLRNLLLVTFDV